MSNIRVGDVASDFVLPSQTGSNVRLSDFRGKRNVVLYFYPRDFTSGCQLEARTFADSYEAFRKLETEVLGVSSDSIESHRRFSSEFNLPFPLLSDSNSKVRKIYGVSATFGLVPGRVTYIIDKSGIIRHMFSSQLKPERHTAEALRSLEAIVERDSQSYEGRGRTSRADTS